jgi:hypothetical protein
VLGRGAAEDDDPRLRFFRPRGGALERTQSLSLTNFPSKKAVLATSLVRGMAPAHPVRW